MKCNNFVLVHILDGEKLKKLYACVDEIDEFDGNDLEVTGFNSLNSAK